ncbi:aminomethyltransferase folate-binding domain-containing protein [Ditylenchus destructor]|nr:aminomethyltransferase folate-binding domain-containing protein [Ditylenchus destructor]
MLIVVAVNLAYNSFYRGQRSTAFKLLKSVLKSSLLSEDIYRAAALLEIQICVDLNKIKLAQWLIRELRTNHCWRNASQNQLDCAEILLWRCGERQTTELKTRKSDAIHWVLLEAEKELKSGGSVRNALGTLLRRRQNSTLDEKRLLDNAIGCVYALAFKDCNMAESYFRSAMLRKNSEGYISVPLRSSLLLYQAALAQLGSGKPHTAFLLFVCAWPYFQDNPRICLRIAECCMQKNGDANSKVSQDMTLHISALSSWNTIKNAAADKCSFSPPSLDCNPEFAAYVIHKALDVALSQKEFSYLLPYLHSLSASVHARLHQFEQSLSSANNLLSLPHVNPKQKLIGMVYKAEAFSRLNQLEDGIVCLQQAAPLPTLPYTALRLVYNRALVETMDSKYEKAENTLKELNNLNPASSQRPEGAHLSLYLDMQRRKSMASRCMAGRAQAVVCGGGLMGLSIAYHLAKRGASVMLFERESVGYHSGTRITSGFLSASSFYADSSSQTFARRSYEMYSKLASGGKFSFNKCGRVYMGTSRASEIQLRRLLSRLSCTNPQAEMIDCPSEMYDRWPMLFTEDIKLAVYSPDDVTLDVHGLCRELVKQTQELGVQIYEGCTIKRVLLSDTNRVYAVDTERGLVETRNFVNAAGIWSNLVPVKEIPDGCVNIAAHPCSYSFLSTEKLPQDSVDDSTPVFIDMDRGVYICPTPYKTICGGFAEGDVKALTIPQHNLTADWHIPIPSWDNFYSVLNRLSERCPSLKQLPQGDLVGGAEMYTPDEFPIIGESSQARGYFLANGLNGHGLAMAGGLGETLAEWILMGQPNINVGKYDVTRFLPLHTTPQYLYERVPETASNVFKNLYGTYQCHTARNLRTSPIHHQLRSAGAIFGEIMGYERPLWYDTSDQPEKPRNHLYYGQDTLASLPGWFPWVTQEYEACRERVGVIDMTSFSKFEVKGPDAVKLLQKLCSADIDKPVGTTVYTGMQNHNGGYVVDCTMSRTGNDSFFIVAPTVQQLRIALWIQRWIEELGMDVRIQDVTSSYTALNIVGPSSRYLMQDITGKSMAPNDFPSFAYRELHVGMAHGIRSISVTHCGELGWVLYIPNEVAQNVYDRIIDAGREYGLRHAGYYVLRHLRIEKFYVYWGQDIDATTTPVECGRTFRVDFNKDFIGKQALLKQLETGVSKKFVQLLVDKHKKENDPLPQGEEPIFRDGKLVGWTTSAAYGFTLGSQVCLGYLQNNDFGISQDFINNGFYEVEIAGRRFPVRVNLHSPSLPMVSSEHPHHYRPTQ